MAYSMTMLAWSLLEYGTHLAGAAGASELSRAQAALRWGTDYFVKAHPSPNVLWAQVRKNKKSRKKKLPTQSCEAAIILFPCERMQYSTSRHPGDTSSFLRPC